MSQVPVEAMHTSAEVGAKKDVCLANTHSRRLLKTTWGNNVGCHYLSASSRNIDIALRADLDTITFIAHADRQWDKTTLDKPI